MTNRSWSGNSPAGLTEKFNGRSSAYRQWREHRLKLQIDWCATEPLALSPALNTAADAQSLSILCNQVRDYGFAVYQWTRTSADINTDVARLYSGLSLTTTDKGVVRDNNGLSLLSDLSGTPRGRFIPYTARAMGWHSDGYYNAPEQALRCFTLHCVQPAAEGGELSVLDDQLLLISLYDENPEMASLLASNNAMTIPANKDDIGHDRPDRSTAVLFNHADGTPGTHFTTRTTNIRWQSPDTMAAAQRMTQLIDEHRDWQHTVRLKPGQGIVTRNILHRREAFTDAAGVPPRQMLRGRFLQAVRLPAGTMQTDRLPSRTTPALQTNEGK